MQIIVLLVLSLVFSFVAVFGTELFLTGRRTGRRNYILLAAGTGICVAASVVMDMVLKAGWPTFYYHTKPAGPATVKLFGASSFFGGLFYALFLMITERELQKKTVLRRLAVSFLIGMCGAAVLEFGFFNLRHYELTGIEERSLSFSPDDLLPHGYYFNRASWKFYPYSWSHERSIELFVRYHKVRNVRVEFDEDTPRTLVKISFNDQAHRDYELIPDHEFIQGVDRSFNIPLHTVGTTYSMLFSFPDPNDQKYNVGLAIPSVTVNVAVPLEIRPVRFILCFLVVFLVSAFFPGSPLWSLQLDLHDIRQIAAVVFLIVMCFCAFVWTVFSSYTGSDLSIPEQKAALNENYLQYNRLVDALMVPRYALLDEPHRFLAQFDDVFDMRQRESRDYEYFWDTAYYNGHYYVYFGVVPAVTVLLPYKMLTGKDLDLDYPILGFTCLFVLGLCAVYTRIVRSCFQKFSFGAYWSGLLLLLTSTNVTWCLRRTLVYELAITSGICFAVWGIFFMLIALDNGKWGIPGFFCSGLCSALAVGCRPTMLFVSIPVFVLAYFSLKSDDLTRGRILKAGAFLIPYAVIGAALMKYNYERFDDPFEFGITYQLTTENRALGIPLLGPFGRLLSIFSSLFTFPRLDMNFHFPFIHLQKPELAYNGMILNSDTVLGIFAYPLMTFLFLMPLSGKMMRERSSFLRPFCHSCLAAALGICITSSAFAVTNRYLTDYMFLAAVPALFSLFCVMEHLNRHGLEKAGQSLAVICAAVGIGFFAVLSLTGEESWFRLINPLYYDKIRYAFSPWL